MAKLLTNRLNFSFDDYRFDIKLPGDVIELAGDSGTGKSLFAYSVFEASLRQDWEYDFKVTKVDSRSSTEDDLQTLLRGSNEKLVVVDNASLLVTKPETLDAIRNCANQVILIGREGKKWGIPTYCVGDLYENFKVPKLFNVQYLNE